MQLVPYQQVLGKKAHFVQGSVVTASHRADVLESTNGGETWQQLTRISQPLLTKVCQKTHLSQRLFRVGVQGVWRHNEDFYCFFNRALHHFRYGESARQIWTVEQGRRPLAQGWCVYDGTVLVGDYWSNPERVEARIHRIYNETGTSDAFYCFSPGQIRHVHAIQRDPFDDQLWVATGDEDHECFLGTWNPRTRRFDWIGSGSQEWRVVSLAFTRDAVFWGSDDPYDNNTVFRWDRCTQTREVIGRTIGPVYYSTVVGPYVLFSTAVEWREGYHDGFSRIYAFDTRSRDFEEVFACKKDVWSAKYFGYGTIEFAAGPGPGDNSFWATLHGLRGGLRSVCFRIAH